MIKDFRKTEYLKKIKIVSLVFFDILQLPHTEMSNSEKLTHPIATLHLRPTLHLLVTK